MDEEWNTLDLALVPWDFYIKSININHDENIVSVNHNIEVGYWQQSFATFNFNVVDTDGNTHDVSRTLDAKSGTAYNLTYNFNKKASTGSGIEWEAPDS